MTSKNCTNYLSGIHKFSGMPSIAMVKTSSTKALLGAGFSAAKDVASIIDPYVPATAKTAAAYAIKQTTQLTATASEAFTQTQTQLLDTANVAKATAFEVLEKSGAKDALESANAAKDAALLQAEQIRTSCVETANGVFETANGVRVRAMDLSYQVLEKAGAVDVVNKGVEVVNATNQRVEDAKKSAVVVVEGWKGRAVRTASSSFDLANSLVARATGTAMNYTPKSVVSLVQAAVETYTVVRTDGLVGLKPYVPTFVVQTGEQTYEIVANVRQSVHDQYSATSGFIVTRVNGVVERVTAVPIVSKLLDRITGLVGHANASAAATTAATSEDNHVTPILMSQVGEDEFHDAPTAVGRDKDNHVSSDLEEVSTMKGEFSVLENGVDVVTV